MMISFTKDLATVVNAAPTVKPMAKSTKFPRRMNFLNSFNINVVCDKLRLSCAILA